MTWVVVGFAAEIIGFAGVGVIGSLHSVGRLRGWRYWLTYYLCWAVATFSLSLLAQSEALGSARWWLPPGVGVVVGLAVTVPLHSWTNREKVRLTQERERFGFDR